MSDELEKCPKCGEYAVKVNKYGALRPNGKYVTCRDEFCMPYAEFYSPAAWNNMAKREKALKARIDAEIKQLKSSAGELAVCGAHAVNALASDTNIMLALNARLSEKDAEIARLKEALTCIFDNITEMSPQEIKNYIEALP